MIIKEIKIDESKLTKSNFPKWYFKLMYDTETSYYSNPSQSHFNNLLSIYKLGIDFYSKINEKYVKFLTMRMNSILPIHFEIEQKLKLYEILDLIKLKLKTFEESKNKTLIEKKLEEESKKKVQKFEKDINLDLILIKTEFKNQRKTFIKRARDKLINKFINKNINDKEKDDETKIILTPIKEIDNQYLKHQLMIRTNQNSNLKKFFFPTDIFFDEERNFLIKMNKNIIKKNSQFNLDNKTKTFLKHFSLSYNYIINDFIKKLIDIFFENYLSKKEKYFQHIKLIEFGKYKDNSNFKGEIILHEENIKFMNEIEELNYEKDKIIKDIMKRFKINIFYDDKNTNEIVNDYIYEIFQIFV